MTRNIAVITGTRAEYGVIRPLLKAMMNSKNLNFSLVVASMHLSEEFGNTFHEIINDGYGIAASVDNIPKNDSCLAMAHSVGEGIVSMANAFDRLKPDIVLVTGDRGEMLAAAIAGGYMNIPIAHIHGGDVSGNVDDAARHAITKFAHIHFPATEKSAERIAHMGEEPFRIHQVGALALDSVLNEPILPINILKEKYGLSDNSSNIMVLQHPVTSESENAAEQMRITMEALEGYSTIVIYPNADTGGRRMIEVIQEYAERKDIRAYKNVPHADFLGLLSSADVLVGNSSSGIIEAPSFGLPVVDIGTRQSGRERASNVISAGYNKIDIRGAIERALSPGFREAARNCVNPYGDGNTSSRIVKTLEEIEISESLLYKKWFFQRD